MKLVKNLLAVAGVMVAGSAFATSTSTDTTFDAITTQLSDWASGSLGKTLSVAMLLVGIAAGIVRQSVIAAVAGVAGALVLTYGPTALLDIFATII